VSEVTNHDRVSQGNPDVTESDVNDSNENNNSSRLPYVVGIGASAGGLEALELLFDGLPPDTGMAFVIVQHLSPDFKSLMDELIRRHTEMAVFRVEDGMKIQSNAIYLLPAGKEMIIRHGCLLLTDKDPTETLTLPIDHFFRSLAQDCGRKAVAIVLSGSGSDGSRGVREVHNMGGTVIAQDPATAAFDSMPNAAEETGVVDISGSPAEISDALLRIVNHRMQRAASSDDEPAVPEDGIKQILRVIRDAYGIDFTYYKPTTVMRRIERRVLLNRLTNLDAYVETISTDAHELNLLYRDLLIGVTEFFRDADAFQLLEEQVLPELILKLPPKQELRVWVAGCATGEEAYSLAMLIHERVTHMNRQVNARIFATDVHRTSLDFASAGIYDESAVRNISAARLDRYFTQTREGYKVSQELRNMVVFAPHNLIKDAPFTRLDLVSCRNLLIYLQPLAQKKALSLFHFSLKTGGVLCLGPSETTGELADEFDVISSHWRLYRKRRDIRLPADMRLPTGISATSVGRSSRASFPVRGLPLPTPTSSTDRELIGMYEGLLNDAMPASLVLDEGHRLVHSFGSVGSLLSIPAGRATSNGLDLLPTELRTVVVGAMQRVNRTGQPVSYSQVAVETRQGKRDVHVTVRNIASAYAGTTYTLIALDQSSSSQSATVIQQADRIEIDDVSRERIDVLETELRHSRESLQATIEELEASNEELQATNEELVASNEELQSTNEELHSVNEELYTVNAEYQKKIGELSELTSDMDNLLNSTDVHTLFLDQELCIRKFTPQMAAEFNLIPADIGRRIDNFAHNISSDNLIDKISRVLATGLRHEEQVRGGRHQFLLRILPYRGGQHRKGVVLTLIDITDQSESQIRFEGTFDNAAVGIAHMDLQGRWLLVNNRLCDILGYSRDELLQTTFQQLTFADDLDADLEKYEALKQGQTDRYSIEKRYIRKDGSLVWISLTVSLQRADNGDPQYAISIIQDISQRKEYESQLNAAIAQRDRFLATLSHELRNPLAAVRSSLAVLRHATASPQSREQAVEVVERQSEQMAKLLDDLLDVARITQDKIRFEMRPLDFCAVIRDATDAMRVTFAARDQHLAVSLPDHPVVVHGDETRLLQIAENLLTNAAKYTAAEGQIDVTLVENNNSCHLSVTDTGIGIAPEMLEHIFNLFVQTGADLPRQEGGMGLGLTLVRSLVHAHDGTIEAFSEGHGKGSRFTVSLPVSHESVAEDTSSRLLVRTATLTRDKLRLALVEDNDDARVMLESLLTLEGFEVSSAADGEAGAELIIRKKPQVALVDIGLPKMDGYRVAQRIRKSADNNDIYLIALTGYGQTADIQKTEAAGFDAHITKPVDPQELIRTLQVLTSD
jgi:two-component system CheB/CheR fusion protein